MDLPWQRLETAAPPVVVVGLILSSLHSFGMLQQFSNVLHAAADSARCPYQ